jgi:hypothetical protein
MAVNSLAWIHRSRYCPVPARQAQIRAIHGMESDMRRFSCFDAATLLAAAGVGFLAGERSHRQDPVNIRICDSVGELSDAPPTVLAAPQPVEEIDLTCVSMGPLALRPQSAEPPLADGLGEMVYPVKYESPVGAPTGPDILATMPYLTDDPSPGLLPPLGDVPLLLPPTPVAPSSTLPDPANPIYQAARNLVDKAADISDKVPLGKPPVSEHPSTTTSEKPITPQPPKANTTDTRPSDAPTKPNSD